MGRVCAYGKQGGTRMETKNDTVRLQLFGDFLIHADEGYDALPAKSR